MQTDFVRSPGQLVTSRPAQETTEAGLVLSSELSFSYSLSTQEPCLLLTVLQTADLRPEKTAAMAASALTRFLLTFSHKHLSYSILNS